MSVGDQAGHLAGELRPLAQSWSGGRWNQVPIAGPGTQASTQLSAVSCSSPSHCLAVGYLGEAGSQDTTQLAEEWNGTSWQVILTGKQAGMVTGFFSDVSCRATAGCIAVGGDASTAGAGRALAEVWSGQRWRLLPVPLPSGARAAELSGISCPGAQCVAVGSYRDNGGLVRPLAVGWTGSSWRPLPAVRGPALVSALNAVSCPTSALCLAVGYSYRAQPAPLAELWQDGRWRVLPASGLSAGLLTGVSCTGPATCLAVGASDGEPVTQEWLGTSWLVRPAARASGFADSELYHVSCAGSLTRCVAVGTSYQSASLDDRAALAQIWNGSSWVLTSTPGL
jgi:hypothetical protein